MIGPPLFTLHDALRRAAANHGGRPAVVTAGGSVSYAELELNAAQVTTALAGMGVAVGDRVAIWAAKSAATVAAQYGICGAGAAYVPIDPLSPPLRAARVLADSGARVVCADARRGAQLAAMAADGPSVAVLGLDDAVPGADIGPADLAGLEPDRRPRACESDLAYVLYTSGSTGMPKGVMLTHRNALAFVEWAVGRFGVTASDRLVSHAPFHFDLSVFDLYGAAAAGASVYLLDSQEAGFGNGMAAAVGSEAITVWYSVPSALTMLLDAADVTDLATLRVVLFAGEVFPTKHLRRLRAALPEAVLANLYGPTETNVCTYYVVPADVPEGDAPIPIGRACENQEVFALDAQGRPAPAGTEGELWVRGPTVMKGYWADPDKTAASLRQNPRHDRFPDPAYRTGDLVRLLPHGDYQFLGRRDHQVKSRGYRIELGEVEAALVSHPSVREAAVVAVPDERIGNALFAYVDSEDAALDTLALKRHCGVRLPRYMVPGIIEVDAGLPHTPTGKVDRQALRERAASSPPQPD